MRCACTHFTELAGPPNMQTAYLACTRPYKKDLEVHGSSRAPEYQMSTNITYADDLKRRHERPLTLQ